MTNGAAFRAFLEDSRRVAILGAAVLVLGAIPAFTSRLQPDTAWLLYAAEHMLDGARPYVDLVEINPPLILWLDALPVMIARIVGLPSALVFNTMVLALVLLSTVWCERLLEYLLPTRIALRHYVALLILFALAPLSRGDFGQREHLFVALAMPYILLTAVRTDGLSVGRWHALCVGAAAGLGIALKPYFMLLWVCLEAAVLLAGPKRRPRFREESLAVVGVGVVYILSVVEWTPEYFQVVRTMAGPYYTFLSNSLQTTALLGDGAQLPIIAMLAYFTLRADTERRFLWSVLAWATSALWLAAVLQHKGWRYHFYPALALSVILCGLMAVDRRCLPVGKVRRLYAAVCLALVIGVVLVTTGASTRQILDPKNPRYDADPDVSLLLPRVAKHAGSHVLMLSWSAASAFPLMTYGGVENASRFNHLWILGALYWKDLWQAGALRYRTREEMPQLERYLNDAVVEDMTRTKPSMIIVLRPGIDSPAWGLRRLDFLGYFRRDPRFARLFEEFTYDGQVREYWLFRRANPGVPIIPPPARQLTRMVPDRGLSGGFGRPALADLGLWAFGILLLILSFGFQRRFCPPAPEPEA
jgi:hypothetical protein